MYGRHGVSCLSIGRFDVFWLCIGTSGLISLSVNLLRREVAGISGRFVAHHLEAGQILPSGIRLFLLFRRQINMKHVFILEPFIRPVDEVGRIGIKVFLQQLLSGIKSCWDRLLVPLVTFLREVTNGTNASLVTFSKKILMSSLRSLSLH